MTPECPPTPPRHSPCAHCWASRGLAGTMLDFGYERRTRRRLASLGCRWASCSERSTSLADGGPSRQVIGETPHLNGMKGGALLNAVPRTGACNRTSLWARWVCSVGPVLRPRCVAAYIASVDKRMNIAETGDS